MDNAKFLMLYSCVYFGGQGNTISLCLDMFFAKSEKFKAMRKLHAEHPSEVVGAEIRKLYSWNSEDDKLINN